MKALAYNVAALDKVLALATQVGDSYKPGNASIERTALAALLEESRKSVTAVLKAEGDLATAINQRQDAFDALPALGLQIIGLAESGDMEDKHLKDLDKMRKRFRSQPFKGTGETGTAEVSTPSETSQRKHRILSYDNKVVTLESIIKFLEEHPSYSPMEPEFSIAGLKEKLAALHAHNAAVTTAKAELTQIREKAKELIFDRKIGVRGRAKMAKRYLRTILGTKSDLYKSISKVKFKNGK